MQAVSAGVHQGLTPVIRCVSSQRPLIEETTMLLVPTRILHAFVSPTMFAQNSANTVFATQHYCRAHQQVYGSVCLGGEQRKATLGAEYVEKNLAAADDFTGPFQEAMTARCWGVAGGTMSSMPRRAL